MFRGHTAVVVGLAFNTDGSRILTSSKDKTVRLWETATGRELQVFTGHTEMVRRLAFHPDGKHALSGGRDGFVRMWELGTAREVRQFQSPNRGIDCLAVSRDGKFLAVGGTMIVLFDVESGKTLSEFSDLQFASTGLTFSADGKRILASGYDGSVRLLDRETSRELFSLRGHREVLWDAKFSPDGKWILTGGGGANVNGRYSKGSDHAIQLWKMPDEKAIEEYSAAN
jgi:WD40 repeat protein